MVNGERSSTKRIIGLAFTVYQNLEVTLAYDHQHGLLH
jgi:hypothetical protein